MQISAKQLAVSKASAQMLIVASVAAFVTIFSLVTCQSLLAQRSYQGRVVAEKEKVNIQLEKDAKAVAGLVKSYKKFKDQPINVIGGIKDGTGEKDADNAAIVLDALPNKYDFPALTSSLEKLFKERNIQITSITGTDDEIAQQAAAAGAKPVAIPIPFSFSVSNMSYPSSQELINILERSIRPMQLESLTLTGGADDITLTITAHTYYQPDSKYNLTTKVVQ